MDVLVVGGGMAGVSIAYELAAEARVTLVEKEPQLAYHTTGRSAAMYLQSYGNPIVRALTVASRVDFEALRELVDGTPLLLPKPLLWVADDQAAHRVEALLATDAPLRRLTPAETVERCPALRPERVVLGAEDVQAMEIDVDLVHQAYRRGLRGRGGEVRTEVEAGGLRATDAGWEIAGLQGRRFDSVVDAAGAWADMVAMSAGARPVGLRPLRRTIFTSPVHGWKDPAAWPFIGDAGERFYFRGEHDQVLVSPADETADVPRDVRPEESDIAAALEVVNQFTTLGLRSVRTAWAGLRTFAPDRSPVAGEAPEARGFFWFAGQGGYGIQMAPALARVGAALVLGRPLPDDVASRGVTPAALSPARFGTSRSGPDPVVP